MSVSLDLVNADLDLCLDLKSPSSQESGLGTVSPQRTDSITS